jgi:hypothetical protein
VAEVGVAEVRIGTGAPGDGDADRLWDWLRDEPELRGRMRRVDVASPPEAMGSVTEIVVQVAAAAAGAAALWEALARSLVAWRRYRGSDVTIEIVGADGRRVSATARRIEDAEPMLREVLGLPAQTPADPPNRVAAPPAPER